MATPSRCSSVKTRNQHTPFVNFSTPLSHGHPMPELSPWPRTAGTGGGWGTKHIHDPSDFSLWVEADSDFRLPQAHELEWMEQKFGAMAISFSSHFLMIETEQPPEPVPLTIGGMPTMFIPKRPLGQLILYSPLEYKHIMGYSNPRFPDPVASFKLVHWKAPTKEQMHTIAHKLCEMASVRRITFMWRLTIVELEVDGQTYQWRSLPGVVAGTSTLYHHSTEPYWGKMRQSRYWVEPDVEADIQDDTNYLQVESRELQPGVRLSSPFEETSGQPSTATTSGVLVRKGDQERMTCAPHGWLESNEVYHPNPSGELIGTINERYDALDVALVKLNPAVPFTNRRYFEADPPRKLMTVDEVLSRMGTWYSADGMSTGSISLLQSGVQYEIPPRPPGNAQIQNSVFNEEDVVYSGIHAVIGATGGTSRVTDGLRGAAIVEQSTGSGGVAGFFQLYDGQFCVVPCVDKLIENGWALV